MKPLLTLLILFIQLTSLSAQKFEWMRSSPTSWGNGEKQFSVTDNQGNVFVIGSFSGILVIGSDTIYSYQSSMCSFISKYEPNGNHLWSKPFAPLNAKPIDVCIDGDGNLFMSMSLYNFFVYEDADTTFNLTANYCLFAFDNDGKLKWAFAHPTQAWQIPVAASTQTTGFYSGAGNTLYKFDSNGNILWSKTATGTAAGNFLYRGLDCNDGNTLVASGITGAFTTGTVTLDAVSVTIATDVSDMAFFMLDTAGNAVWGQVYPAIVDGSSWNKIHQLRVNQASEVYYVYEKGNGTLNYIFGNDTIFNPYCSWCMYNAILKMDANGNPVWARSLFLGDYHVLPPYDMTLNDDEDIIVSASTNAGLNYFGNQSYDNNYGLGASSTLLIGKIDQSGNHQWMKSDHRLRGQLVSDYVSGISSGPNNIIYIAGRRNLGLASTFNLGCHSDSVNTVSGTDYFLAAISEDTEPVPFTVFDFQVDGLTVFFENQTINGEVYSWNFGDGQSNSLENPSHTYAAVGNYNTCLMAENNCGQKQICKDVTLEGLGSVAPNRMAADGYHKLQVKGGFATDPTLVKFIKSGAPDIIPDTLQRTNAGLLEVNIKLIQAPIGFYDLVYHSPSFSDTLTNAILIEAADSLKPYVTVTGPSAVRPNTWAPMRITVTNPSNSSYYGIPVYITLNPNLETFIPGVSYPDSNTANLSLQLGSQFAVVHSMDGSDSVLFSGLLISEIQPNESRTIMVFVKSPVNQTNIIRAYVSESYFTPGDLAAMDMKVMTACNFLPKCFQCALDLIGLVPVAGCTVGVLNLGCSIGAKPFKQASASDYFFNIAQSASSALLSCATGVGGPQNIYSAVSNSMAAGIVADFVNGVTGAASTCIGANKCDPKDSDDWFQLVNNSVDPNYKTGPQGFTPDNFINKNDVLDYTIHFENLDTATAPASEVFIIDTLDVNMLDLSTFAFTGFGQTDSVVNFNFPLTEFATEINLQPGKNAILRVTGSIDTLSGAVRWAFRSLDPVTTALAPLLNDGFLNPNISPPEGEGFVSFRVKLKNNVGHLQQITNSASIFFDNNAPIITNTYLNTVDTIRPVSNILPLPANSNDSVFILKWTGFDADAGINRYDIFMSENDSPYVKILSLTSKDSILFTGTNGSKYEFYSIARDHARNIEEPPVNPAQNPDAVTTITVGIAENEAPVQFSVYPNPASGHLSVKLYEAIQGDIELIITDALGRKVNTTVTEKTGQEFNLDISGLRSGMYLLTVKNKNATGYKSFTKLP